MSESKDFRNMTSETIGADLLKAFVAEIKLLPDVWQKMSKTKQDDVLDRLRNRVETNVKMAVHMLAAEGRVTIAGALDQITIKDGVKAVVKFGTDAENLHELYDVAGKSILLVVADSSNHMVGIHGVVGETDQRAMDLGHEYHDNDGGGMDGESNQGEVIEGQVLGLPSPDSVTPTDEEVDEAWESGYQTAADGKPESDCPVMKGALCIAWVKGWKAWHEQNPADDAANDKKAA